MFCTAVWCWHVLYCRLMLACFVLQVDVGMFCTAGWCWHVLYCRLMLACFVLQVDVGMLCGKAGDSADITKTRSALWWLWPRRFSGHTLGCRWGKCETSWLDDRWRCRHKPTRLKLWLDTTYTMWLVHAVYFNVLLNAEILFGKFCVNFLAVFLHSWDNNCALKGN